jgi:uncharacterized protein YgbK (DUF1537 family)
MNRVLYAAVADDDTGASDLAGMFADQGVRVVLALDIPDGEELAQWTKSAAGVIFATASRALPPEEAYQRTKLAVVAAARLDPRTLQIKYCSTFDSTERGNIGPSIDAAMDVLGAGFTVALPALPVNGRTTYCGYHFVKGELLSDSPMRNHPLTPMTNPNLVNLLDKQTRRRVGLTPYNVVDTGVDAIRRHWQTLQGSGVEISIVDCLSDKHAAEICEAACDLKLITGGSAFGTHLPAAWRRREWIGDAEPDPFAGLGIAQGSGALIVAGSCSAATARQNAAIRDKAEVIEIDPVHLLENGAESEAERSAEWLRQGRSVLLKTKSDANDISSAHAWGREQGWDAGELGSKIAAKLAAVTSSIVEEQMPEALLLAGGETSGAICRALGIRALAVGRNIEPGVPLCLPLNGPGVPLVLKSGNFGSDDFYRLALGTMRKRQSAAGRGHS